MVVYNIQLKRGKWKGLGCSVDPRLQGAFPRSDFSIKDSLSNYAIGPSRRAWLSIFFTYQKLKNSTNYQSMKRSKYILPVDMVRSRAPFYNFFIRTTNLAAGTSNTFEVRIWHGPHSVNRFGQPLDIHLQSSGQLQILCWLGSLKKPLAKALGHRWKKMNLVSMRLEQHFAYPWRSSQIAAYLMLS